jgi:hypothetical protein
VIVRQVELHVFVPPALAGCGIRFAGRFGRRRVRLLLCH